MPLHALPNAQLRDVGKRSVEALEMWLRRLIDDELCNVYGPTYLQATRPNGDNLISRGITKDMLARRASEPSRYPRAIDAALLEDAIKIICNPELFKYFEGALRAAFPLGADHARLTLERMVAPRNALYHANPVGVRQIEQVICYSNDTIASMKSYYMSKNMDEQFNAPTILQISDSLGNVFHSNQLTDLGGVSGRAAIRGGVNVVATLRVGDTLSLEIEVDPSFARSAYEVQWHVPNDPAGSSKSEKIVLPLQAKHVNKMLQIRVLIISNASWHRHGAFDDSIAIAYRVLPPP